MAKPRVLSGIQPTGNLHLGNYLGAIRNWVKLQDSHECFYMLADLHAITVFQNPADLTRNTREIAAALIACGIDPKKSVIFPQSAVNMHAELAWILSNHAPLGWLDRMTQFKDKSGVSSDDVFKSLLIAFSKHEGHLVRFAELASKPTNIMNEPLFEIDAKMNRLKHEMNQLIEQNSSIKNAKLGLYSYPVLMAADILGYHAHAVPVGEDQKQHLELARDIAGAFNRAYNEEFFPIPEPLILPQAARIMSLNDGTRKMSKSEESDYSRINLTDDADTIANKIKKAQTDSDPSLTYDKENRPSVANLITIYAALADSTPEHVVAQFASLKTGQFKAQLADLAVAKLSPITARMRELMADVASIDAILKDGAAKANAVAQPILEETQKRVGFLKV